MKTAVVVRTPGVCSGDYRLADTRITVRSIVKRFHAGERIASIADGYLSRPITADEIEDVLRWFATRPKKLQRAILRGDA